MRRELAHRRVDEPGRVVVAVAASRTVDEDDVLGPEDGDFAAKVAAQGQIPWTSLETPARPPMLPFFGNEAARAADEADGDGGEDQE